MRINSLNSLISNGRMYKCVLGKTGVLTKKFEGDGAAPSGVFPLIRVLYRPDRVACPFFLCPQMMAGVMTLLTKTIISP